MNDGTGDQKSGVGRKREKDEEREWGRRMEAKREKEPRSVSSHSLRRGTVLLGKRGTGGDSSLVPGD